MKNKLNWIAILLAIVAKTMAQQTIVDSTFIESVPSSNATLVKAWEERKEFREARQMLVVDTIQLGTNGFLEDFSYPGPYPDANKWLDDNVFVNRDYPYSPISTGVATFDGIKKDGSPYDSFAPQTSSGMADTLTSKPINLAFLPSDSVYFSFYYQPQGRGNAPESADSLILEFKDATASISAWKHIWAKRGSTLAANDSSWKLVMIPITNPLFLKNGFQFRFKNYATLSGNGDQWSIDYIYLNKDRSKNDTLFEDVTFIYNPPTLLNRYSAMPWRHYQANNNKTAIDLPLRNNFNQIKNVNFKHCIYDNTGASIYCSAQSTSNVNPVNSSGYFIYTASSLPALPIVTAPSEYTFECVLNSTPDNLRLNDTIRYKQKFDYHYGYDDGTAESAFALGGVSNGELAHRFESTVGDTLRYIDIYFNPLWSNITLYTIKIKVWADNNGSPGTLLYASASLAPYFNGTGYNKFSRFALSSPMYIPASTFYVGFLQNTNQFLNVGVDKNSDNKDKIYYNTSGTWNLSPYKGTLMIHPVFGSHSDFAGVNEHSIKTSNTYYCYPNPATDKLFIGCSTSNHTTKYNVEVIDIVGKIIIKTMYTSDGSIDIAELQPGVYFLRVSDAKELSILKFIKQ